MYKILGVYVFNVYPFPVANILTADNNDARKPPTISYMWALPPITENLSHAFNGFALGRIDKTV
jgi:hypothetical protein